MARFTNVELKQPDQLLKEKISENTYRSSDKAWNVWRSFLVSDDKTVGQLIIKQLDAAITDIKFI